MSACEGQHGQAAVLHLLKFGLRLCPNSDLSEAYCEWLARIGMATWPSPCTASLPALGPSCPSSSAEQQGPNWAWRHEGLKREGLPAAVRHGPSTQAKIACDSVLGCWNVMGPLAPVGRLPSWFTKSRYPRKAFSSACTVFFCPIRPSETVAALQVQLIARLHTNNQAWPPARPSSEPAPR